MNFAETVGKMVSDGLKIDALTTENMRLEAENTRLCAELKSIRDESAVARRAELHDLLKWVDEHKVPSAGDEDSPWNAGRWQFVRLVKWEIIRRLHALQPTPDAPQIGVDSTPSSTQG